MPETILVKEGQVIMKERTEGERCFNCGYRDFITSTSGVISKCYHPDTFAYRTEPGFYCSKWIDEKQHKLSWK